MKQERNRKTATDSLVAELKEALSAAASGAGELSSIRRKLRTLTHACGYKRASSTFLEDLKQRLAQAGVYSDPALTDSGLRQDDWILFATGPFPADSLFFPKERDLQRFVDACLGNGPLRNLEPFREGRRPVAWEYRLPNKLRIDLLCQERTKSGKGALVAIELKRDHEKGTVEQMVRYLDALKRRFPRREVRGIIISGREDQVAATRLKELRGYRVEWLCYHVGLTRVASTT